ncbi:PAS domain-containing sensor histidine kinase [Halogeometricum borinquense]|uniref:PAS domain-containing sensor histidine kinase n=1 Tax=Halogeometricum borinquense TaxID=60847 RepID=A0A6C0UHE0_9EURY|nr:PAS domain-containing sensor histidine kinase [Halogeometricum borinquense]QIB74902.1 PAS domain-containing sensor histidine kinase [Halogeometricum borinquense]QIQ76098.1 PAS domain-containing sensor histidine kinase [Halogeometricum borinquense]
MNTGRLVEEVEEDPFAYLPVLVVVTRPDEDGVPVIEDCNDRFLERLGYDYESVIGRRVTEFYTAESAANHLHGGYERARRGDYDREERDFLTADGNVISTVVRATPRRVDGEVVGVIAVYVDVTEQKWREQHVNVLNRVMRHNIRNDLNVLHGHAEMLAQHDDESVVESANVVGRTVERWLSLTEKATEIERLFEETTDRSAHLPKLLHEVQTAVEMGWPDATIQIEQQVADVYVSSRLSAVIDELCENGVKHTSCDSPEVRIDTSRVDGNWVKICVTDEGPGIPDHERAVLRHGEETDLVHGSGLGFWLVRTVVRRIGGHLRVADAPDGSGSVVTVYVPIVEETNNGDW